LPFETAQSAAASIGGELNPLISVLRGLPRPFHDSITNLTVTIYFPSTTTQRPPNRTSSGPGTRFGNAMKPKPASPHEYIHTPNYVLMEQIVVDVNKFRNLNKLDIVICPPSNTRTPMSFDQLSCFLPYFDLDFVNVCMMSLSRIPPCRI
jgi:hypothetical protein